MHEHPASTGIAVGQESSNMPNAIIPKVRLPDASLAHAREYAAAAEISLTREDLAEIDAAHKPPRRKHSLLILSRYEKRAKIS